MRYRVKIWADTAEIELNPTFMSPAKYADLPTAGPEDVNEFVAALETFQRARAKFINVLSPPEPLSPEEIALLKKDEVIA